jgi:hypothetical protein
MVCDAIEEQLSCKWILPSLPDSNVGTPEWYAMPDGATHMSTYPAASSFALWLERQQNELGLNRPGIAILELGAGQGWLGNVLASNTNSADVVLTDRLEAVNDLHSYAAGAREGLMQSCTSLRVEALDWNAFTPSQLGFAHSSLASLPAPLVGDAFDVIVGTDLVATSSLGRALAWVIRALLEKGVQQGVQRTSVFYGHWCRSPRILALFLEHCSDAGLTCEDCTEEPLNPVTPFAKQDLMNRASPEIDAPNVEMVMPKLDSNDDIDWTDELFKDSMMWSDAPMFKVYRFRLGN